MHAVIATVGTRGDVQPYVAIGKELVQRGHRVTLATHEDHRALAETHGLGFRPVCGSFRALMDSDAGRRWLESADSPRKYMRAFRELFEPLGLQWIRDFEGAIGDADGVLVHSFAMSSIIALQHRDVPYVVLSPFGAIPSGDYMMGLPQIPFVTRWLTSFLFRQFLDQAWSVGADDVARYLEGHGVRRDGPLWRHQLDAGVAHLHVWSEHLLARPSDWPECGEVTGFCFLDAPNGWTPPSALVDFLSAGPKPVYVGFGSMTGMEPEALARVTHDALRAAGQRAVIGMGWGGMRALAGADDVLVIDDAPHDWLFPRVSAVVHHCGAGTTAAALRAGRPSVAVPFFGDQPYWARSLASSGAAPPPIAKQKLTSERLADAITRAVSDVRHVERAEALGGAIRLEQGAAKTAERALHHLARGPRHVGSALIRSVVGAPHDP